MLCDHQLISNHLFDYLDGTLSPQVHKQVAYALNQCADCQATYAQAVQLQQVSHQWREQTAPEWHRTKYAVRPPQKATSWLNWSAMATSTLAILMVLFQVQITSNPQGFNIAFGNSNRSQVESLVKQKMLDFKKEQNLLLDARFIAEQDKQNLQNKLLMASAIEKTRDERRDDLNFLITGIQTQRFEDKQKVEKRLAYLADNQIENNRYINRLMTSNSSNGENQ